MSGRASGALGVAVATDGVRTPVSSTRIAHAVRLVLRAENVEQALISVALLNARAMATMNRLHLGHRGPTDVISFGFGAAEGTGVVGDIYVCPSVARQNAKVHRCGVREELLRLVVHGVLHVLGHDHPVDDRREHSAMWKRQEQLLVRVLARTA